MGIQRSELSSDGQHARMLISLFCICNLVRNAVFRLIADTPTLTPSSRTGLTSSVEAFKQSSNAYAYGKIKVKNDCLWKQKKKKNLENLRLGLIETLRIQHCSLRGCIHLPSAGFDFQNNQDGLNDTKGNKI